MPSSTNDWVAVSGLLAAIRAGDEQAVATFIQRYEPMLRCVLRVRETIRWLQSRLDSQDLVQSVFIKVIAAIQGERAHFSDEAGLEAFLRTASRNRLRDHVRRQKAARRDRQRTIAGGPAALVQLPEAAPSPSRFAEVREQIARVEGCAAPADLEVLRERVDGTDWKELATARNLTPDALRKRIERVRKRLQETLAE
jgi:RNA polymerase sigma factor (sigma-70 family)